MTLKFADTHNMVAFLSKPAESEGFKQIMDFLNANPIRYALMINPTIYISCIEQFWATVKAKTVNGEVQLYALVDAKKIIITESIVRRDLQLEDAEGVNCLPNATIFEQLALMSAKTTAWNEFSSTMASAIICLATNQKFNFSKYIFESIVKNLDNLSRKFLMYLRNPKRKDTQIPQSSGPTKHVADEAVYKELDESLVMAATTTSSLQAECEKPMGDTIAQTRFENVSKLSNDPLLARVLAEQEVAAKDVNFTVDEVTLAQALIALKSCNTPNENAMLLEDQAKVQDKGKGIMVEEPVKMKKKYQIIFDEQEAKRLQAEFDEEESLAREKDEANVALTKEWDDIQAKVDADYMLA
ncbi:hypothetical protein Tco_0882125 [Tanacetum coccineum]